MKGALTTEQTEFVEEWEAVTNHSNWIHRLNARGDVEPTHIEGGGTRFKLSTYERILTEDAIKSVDLNPFRNGAFRPVIVPDDVTVETNPNALSDEEIRQAFKVKSNMAWTERLKMIDSADTLKRMIDLADSGNAEILHNRYNDLLQRYEEVRPDTRQKDADRYEGIS